MVIYHVAGRRVIVITGKGSDSEKLDPDAIIINVQESLSYPREKKEREAQFIRFLVGCISSTLEACGNLVGILHF